MLPPSHEECDNGIARNLETAQRMTQWLETVQKQLHAIIRDLIPVEVGKQGFVGAFRELARQTSHERSTGFGLRLMAYCAGLIGATVALSPGEQGGTQVICTVLRGGICEG